MAIHDISLFKGTIHIALSAPVLKTVSFIHFRRGDETIQFSKMAEDCFQSPNIREIEITRNEAGKHQYIRLMTSDPTPLDTARKDKIKAVITPYINEGKVVDEKALLAWSNADKQIQYPDNSFEGASTQFIANVVVPAIKKHTTNEQFPNGHDVSIRFVRFIDAGDEGIKLGLAMGQQCKSCTTAFASTVKKCNEMTSDFLKQAGLQRPITGAVILPTQSGSPSITMNFKLA